MSSAQIAAIAANERVAQLEARVAELERHLALARAKLPLGHDAVPEWMVQEEPTGG